MAGDGVVGHAANVGADKNDARILWRRRQHHAHMRAGMNANARAHGRTRYGLLQTHR
jgi:hypothetical protein